MEVLNNIWTAISTPNERLLNLFSIPFTIIEAILIMSLYISLLNIKASKKQKFIYICFFTAEKLVN